LQGRREGRKEGKGERGMNGRDISHDYGPGDHNFKTHRTDRQRDRRKWTDSIA